jgi:hypothetical protein
MKIFIALVFAALTSFAFASPGNDGCVGNCGTNGGGSGDIKNTNNIGVSNRISNDVRNNANAFAAAQAGAKSNAQNLTTTDVRNANNNTNGGNTLSVTTPADTSLRYSGGYEVKNVPSFALGNVYPTAPCMGSSQVGGSGVGFSIGIGTSWTDDECGIRETARSFAGANLKEDALAILCTSKYAAAAPSCKAQVKPE